jgi:serine/threonine protein phosphatase PrpC
MQPTVLSEVGLRENNEDAAFASPRLLAVADGLGARRQARSPAVWRS